MTPAELRAEWVKALRSDRYTQTQHKLSHHGKFCCLGVLCDVANTVAGIGEWDGDDFVCEPDGEGFDHSDTQLPTSVMVAAGVCDEDGGFKINDALREKFPELPTGTVSCSLVELNDDYDWDFNQIADLVEASPEGMFEEIETAVAAPAA